MFVKEKHLMQMEKQKLPSDLKVTHAASEQKSPDLTKSASQDPWAPGAALRVSQLGTRSGAQFPPASPPA